MHHTVLHLPFACCTDSRDAAANAEDGSAKFFRYHLCSIASTYFLRMANSPETSDHDASISGHRPESKEADPSGLTSSPPLPSLWPFRLWYLSSFSAFSCLSPYLVLYYHSVGLTQGQIGVLLVLQPFISIPMGAVWGALVDRLQQEKPILLITIIINALIRFSLLFASTFSQFCLVLIALYTVSSPAQLLGDVMALRALPDKSNYGKLVTPSTPSPRIKSS